MTLLESAKALSSFRRISNSVAALSVGEHLPERDVDAELGKQCGPAWMLSRAEPAPAAWHDYAIRSSAGCSMLRRAIGGIDGYLSYRCGVVPYSRDERC